ncbi:MAG: peptidyl-prolyl cis-trans isomerase [Woeseiaceae bacterium]|nr:peptidyl-prolyl cis-trans isomerase [Woeseiaceae bacterium]
MREKFTGTFALVLLALIGLSFVFFGLNYSFIGQSYAARVDGEEINATVLEQEYRDVLQRNPQLASLTGELRLQVRRNVLDQLIAEQLIDNFLNEQGYRVGDEQIMEYIRDVPEFQLDGKFDMETYRNYLLERGFDPVRFERLQRNALRQQQLQLSMAATAIVTPAEYRRYLNLMAEQRVVTLATVEPSDVEGEITITDEMIVQYYDDNPGLFQLPETVDIEYIEISRSDVAEGIDVSDEDLQAYYDDNRSRYLQDEQRRARHILILSNDDPAAAEAGANEVLARLEAGESFDALAAELSEDTLTAQSGGDFGALTRSQYPEELAPVIFSMNEGDVAGPVESDFGFHVLRLDEILERGPLPLNQVRGELLSELRQREAEDRYRDLEKSLSDALFDLSDMQAIAEATGLDVKTATGITRNGGEPFGSNQAAIDAIFDELVLEGGQISEVTELDADSAAIFKVANYNPATRQPLDEVREQIVDSLQTQQAEALMVERAERMLEAINAGDDFAAAADAAGLAVREPQMLTRTDQSIDQALIFEVFAAGKPAADAPVYGRVRTLDGSYHVYSLDAVLPGRPESIPLAERDQGKLFMAQQSGVNDFQAFVRALQDDADIVINDDVVAADDLFQ